MADDEAESKSERDGDRSQRFHRRGLLITSLVYTTFFVGAFFGWGPMQLLLEENGAFSWKCDNTTQDVEGAGVCPAQTATLLNVPLIATTTEVLSPLLGQFLDHFGAPITAVVMTGAVWTGLTFLIVASTSVPGTAASVHLDRLLFAAFALLAMSTWLGGLLTVQTGLYFAGHTKSRVIFLLNSLFDAGSATYLVLWFIRQATNASLTAIAGGYLAVCVLVESAGLYFWYKAIPEHDPEQQEHAPDLRSPSLASEELVEDDMNDMPKGNNSNDGLVENQEEGPPAASKQSLDADIQPIDTEVERSNSVSFPPEALESFSLGTPTSDSQSERLAEPYVIVAKRSPKQQLLSMPYLLLCIFFGIQTASTQWTLTTTRDFLADLGDNNVNNRYLTIFTLLMPASVVGVPFVDVTIRKFGFAVALQGVNLLALGYNLVRVCSNNLNVQILGFVFFSFFRSFLFGVTFSFLPTLLANTVVGRAVGIMYAIAGLTGFISIPLAKVAVERFNGNFLVPNIVFTVLVLPCVLATWGLGREIRRELHAKEIAREAIGKDRLRPSYGGELAEAMAGLSP